MVSLPLARPGVVYLAEEQDKRARVLTGPSAGWMIPKGILDWSNEVALVAATALTDEVLRATKGVLPTDQMVPSKYPLSSEAAKSSRLVAVSGRLTSKLIEAGVRIHTVGYDRVSGGFYYLAEGGGEDPARFEGELVATIAGALGDAADNAALDRGMVTIIDRLLTHFSKGQLDELSVELAASLPRYAADGSGMEGVDLDAFEKALSELVGRSEKHFTELELLASLIERAAADSGTIDVPLMGAATTEGLPSITIDANGAKVTMPQWNRWFALEGATPSKTTEALERPTTNLEASAPIASAPQPASPRPASQPPMPAAPPRPSSNRPAAEPVAAAPAADTTHKPTMIGMSPNAEELAMLDAARKQMEEAAAAKARSAAEAKAAEEKRAAAEASAKAAAERAAADAKAAGEKAAAAAKAEEEAKAAAAKAEEEAKAAKAAKEAAEAKAAEAAKAEAKKPAEEAKAAAKTSERPAEKKQSKPPAKLAAQAEAAKVPMEKSGSKTWMIAVAVIIAAIAAWKLMGK